MRTERSRATAATQTAARVLVVEDEASIRQGLCDVLAYHGFAPHGVETGEEGLREGADGACDLVVLDLMLPGIDGFEVCEALRAARPRLPILMLTARGAEADVLRGFRCGADDYVTKPFSVPELLARTRALLRRTQPAGDAPDEVRLGSTTVDFRRCEAQKAGTPLHLTPKEYDALRFLAARPGEVATR